MGSKVKSVYFFSMGGVIAFPRNLQMLQLDHKKSPAGLAATILPPALLLSLHARGSFYSKLPCIPPIEQCDTHPPLLIKFI